MCFFFSQKGAFIENLEMLSEWNALKLWNTWGLNRHIHGSIWRVFGRNHTNKTASFLISLTDFLRFNNLCFVFRSEEVQGNWCNEMVGTKTETRREKTGKYKTIATRCSPTQPKCNRTFKWVYHHWLINWRKRYAQICIFIKMLSCTLNICH